MGQTEQSEETTDASTNGSSSKAKFKFEGSMQREEAIAYFQAIIDGLKKGSLHFKRGDRSLVVSPGQRLDVEVKASRKGDQEKVAFELAWRPDDSDLEISAG